MIRSILLTTLLLISLSLMAQTRRNVAERVTDKKQIAQQRAQLARDSREWNDYRATVAALDRAVENRELARARKLRQEVLADMHREIAQAKGELGQFQAEVGQSKRERHAEGREVRQDRRAGRPLAAGAERRDRRDDQRDLRDDRRDRNQAINRLLRMERIYQELTDYAMAWDGALAQQRRQINEFGDLMEADLRALKLELGEDKGELREDRRETRSDRRH